MASLADLYKRYGRPVADAVSRSVSNFERGDTGPQQRAQQFLNQKVGVPLSNAASAAGRSAVTGILRPGVAGGDIGYRQQVADAGGARAYDQRAIQNFNVNGRTDRDSNVGAMVGGVAPYFIPGANAALTGAQFGSAAGNISSQQGIRNNPKEFAQEAGLAALNLIPGLNESKFLKAATAGSRPLETTALRAGVSGLENVARGQGASAIEGNGLQLDKGTLAGQFALGAGSHLALNPGETLASGRQLAKGTAQFSRNVGDFENLAAATRAHQAPLPEFETSTVNGVQVRKPADYQTITVPQSQAETILRKGGSVDPQVINSMEPGPKVSLTLDSNRRIASWNADDQSFAKQIYQHAVNGSHIQSRQGGFVGNGKEGEPVPGAQGKIKDPRKLFTEALSPAAGNKGYGSAGQKLEEPLRDNNRDFNVNRMNLTPEGKQVLSENVDANAQAFKAVTGERLTNRETIQAAAQTSKVFTKAVGREQTKDWQATLLNTRQQLAKSAESGVVTRDFLENLVAVKAAGTDAARKLQSFSINADPKESTAMERMVSAVLKNDQNVDEILRASVGVDFNDPRQAAAFYRQFVAPKASEWLDLLRYNSMLSSPNTHINNGYGNVVMSGIVKPVEKSLAGGIDFLAHGTNGKRTHFAGEGPAYSVGYIKSVGEAAHAFADVMTGKTADTNLDTNRIGLAPGGGFAGGAEKVLGFPMKMLEASDQFFTALAKGGELNALKVKQRKGVKVANPELVAENAAAKTLFRGDLGDKSEGYVLNAIDTVTNQLQSLRSSDNPLVANAAKFTVPFLKTPINIFKQGLEYSPAGIATLPGNANKTEQLAKAAIGSAVFAGAATLLGSNRLTWAEPTSEKERNAFKAAQMQPYAVKVGDNWVSYSKLGPLAFPIAMVAAIDDAEKNKKLDQSTTEQILSGVAKYGGFLADQTYAKGIGDLIKSAKTESGVAQVVANDVQQLVPYRALMGWMERLQDDTQRKPDAKAGIVEKQVQYMLAQIPWASSSVPARTDQYGEPVRESNNVLNAFSPLKVTTENPQAKSDYQAIADKRVANARSESEKSQLTQGASQDRTSPQGALPEGLKQLSNGSYAFRNSEGTVVTEKNPQKAALALAKDQVASGAKEQVTVGDNYVYTDIDGEVKTASVSKIRSSQAEAQYALDLQAAKRSKDFQAFSRLSEQEYNRLGVQLQKYQQNPFVNGADILATQKKMQDLAYSVANRTGFKGSASGGKGRKVVPPAPVRAGSQGGSFKVARAKSPSTLLKKYSVRKPKFSKR